MVRASHWSSEGYRLYTYVTFTYHLSPCSSMIRASHWSSEGYRLYIYVTEPSLIISVHVAQWLEHLAGHQKVTGCTYM